MTWSQLQEEEPITSVSRLPHVLPCTGEEVPQGPLPISHLCLSSRDPEFWELASLLQAQRGLGPSPAQAPMVPMNTDCPPACPQNAGLWLVHLVTMTGWGPAADTRECSFLALSQEPGSVTSSNPSGSPAQGPAPLPHRRERTRRLMCWGPRDKQLSRDAPDLKSCQFPRCNDSGTAAHKLTVCSQKRV